MASINNVTLKLVENGGAAAALVTYRITGSPTDDPGRTFTETVKLVGADESAGESGADKVLPGVGFEGSVTPPFGALLRTRLMALPAKDLNEDRGPGPFDFRQDEIFAQVTLTRNSAPHASGRSDLVKRGGLIIPPIVQGG